MAHDLGLQVVAEGVENDKKLEFLRHMECDTVQGYLLGKPMPEDEFADFLQENWAQRGQPR
jgi:EAL domain-containing protein (putative c-di-GMP-specific phosphodiesterase class I)